MGPVLGLSALLLQVSITACEVGLTRSRAEESCLPQVRWRVVEPGVTREHLSPSQHLQGPGTRVRFGPQEGCVHPLTTSLPTQRDDYGLLNPGGANTVILSRNLIKHPA